MSARNVSVRPVGAGTARAIPPFRIIMLLYYIYTELTTCKSHDKKKADTFYTS